MQQDDRRTHVPVQEAPGIQTVWPGRKAALGVASLFMVVGLAAISCGPDSAARGIAFPQLTLPHLPFLLPAERGISAPPAPAGVDASVAATPEVVPEPETPPAPADARPQWQAPDVPRIPYRASVERWRPMVRQLLAEMWDEGRLDGHAARLDDDLVLALIQQESGGNPEAESWAGAIGLMQVMPFTFADMMHGDKALADVIDRPVMFDVTSNMRAGLRYLALAMNAHEGNVYWALASYNAGIEAVDDWRAVGLYAVPPIGGYWETADYAQIILRTYLRHRPDVKMHVPDPMPYEHVPGAVELLVNAGRW